MRARSAHACSCPATTTATVRSSPGARSSTASRPRSSRCRSTRRSHVTGAQVAARSGDRTHGRCGRRGAVSRVLVGVAEQVPRRMASVAAKTPRPTASTQVRRIEIRPGRSRRSSIRRSDASAASARSPASACRVGRHCRRPATIPAATLHAVFGRFRAQRLPSWPAHRRSLGRVRLLSSRSATRRPIRGPLTAPRSTANCTPR